MEGRCRSCSSAAQCYELAGQLACVPTERRRGKQCHTDGVQAEYSPMPTAQLEGHPLGAVAQDPGAPESIGLLRADTMATPPGARLAIVWWHQRSGEFDEFLDIGYDVSFEGQNDMNISFADIALPTSENLICFRACRDRSICPCTSPPEIALGTILVAIDTDRNGKLSVDELRAEQIGSADIVIGWAPSQQTSMPKGFDGIFESTIRQGFAAYERDELGLLTPVTQTASKHQLTLCPSATPACVLPARGLLCHIDCERDWGLNRFGL